MKLSFFIMVFLLFCTIRGNAQSRGGDLLVNANADKILQTVRSYATKKPVLLNFWATWCVPCVEEFPDIVKLSEKYKGQFALILVSCDFNEARSEAAQFLKKQGVNFTTFFKIGKDNEFIQKISTEWTGALPYTIIYNKQGDVSDSWKGKADISNFESALNKVLTVK